MGSWASLWETGNKDASGNVIKGDALAIDTNSLFVSSEGSLVTVLGVEDLVIVATMDALLVLPLDRTQDVKTVIDQLKGRPPRRVLSASTGIPLLESLSNRSR